MHKFGSIKLMANARPVVFMHSGVQAGLGLTTCEIEAQLVSSTYERMSYRVNSSKVQGKRVRRRVYATVNEAETPENAEMLPINGFESPK